MMGEEAEKENGGRRKKIKISKKWKETSQERIGSGRWRSMGGNVCIESRSNVKKRK